MGPHAMATTLPALELHFWSWCQLRIASARGRRAHVPEWLASYGAPTALGACIEHCRGCVSGGLRSQYGTFSLYQSHSTFSWMCNVRAEAMVAIGQAVVYE
eukprot:6819587-Prymnesium_polylepis.1